MINADETKTALNQMLAGRLTVELWDFLDGEGYVNAVLDPNEPETLNDLAVKARKVLAVSGAKQPANAPKMLLEKNTIDKTSKGADRHRMRQKALSVLFAKHAKQDEHVNFFRKKFLSKEFPLPWEKVENWIFRAEYEEIKKHKKETYWAYAGTLEYGVPGTQYAHRVPVAKDGKLNALRVISEYLAYKYRWTEAQATVFVLTDVPPLVTTHESSSTHGEPLSVTSRITLTLDPVLTDKEVAAIYRRARQRMLKKDKKGKVRFRVLGDKAHSLAIFEAKRPEGKTYKEKMKSWNKEVSKEHPEWKYEQESIFGRDCKKATQRLLEPDYFDWGRTSNG